MKLLSLGKSATFPCFLLEYRGASILIDCPASPAVRQRNDSERKLEAGLCVQAELDAVDISSIDVILLSHHRSFLGLLLIEDWNDFRGVVYATEPTVGFGRLFIEETLQGLQACQERYDKLLSNQASSFSSSPLFYPSTSSSSSSSSFHPISASRALSILHKRAKELLNRVHSLHFDQHMAFLRADLKIIPRSSGYSIGACNWQIKCSSSGDVVTVVCASSAAARRHSLPLSLSSLSGSNLLILSSLSSFHETTRANKLAEIAHHVESTIRSGGNVLLPSYSSGIVFDLIEYIAAHLKSQGLSLTPLVLLSPAISASLTYANILSEWLCASKSQRAFKRESPFVHDDLIAEKRLHVFSTLQEFEHVFPSSSPSSASSASSSSSSSSSPCVLFCDHPSLMLGHGWEMLLRWGGREQNVVIVSEPDVLPASPTLLRQHLAQLYRQGGGAGEFQMRTAVSVIDPRLNVHEANQLLAAVKPKHLIVPECYCQSPPSSTSSSASSSSTTAAAPAATPSSLSAASQAQQPASPSQTHEFKRPLEQVTGHKRHREDSSISSSASPSSSSSLSPTASTSASSASLLRNFHVPYASYKSDGLDVVEVDFESNFMDATISAKLAEEVRPVRFDGDVLVSSLNGVLVEQDGTWSLQPTPPPQSLPHYQHHQQQQQQKKKHKRQAPAPEPKRLLWGSLSAAQLLEALQQRQISATSSSSSSVATPTPSSLSTSAATPGNTYSEVKSEAETKCEAATETKAESEKGAETLIKIESLDAEVLLHAGGARIITNNTKSRRLLAQVITGLLKSC